MKTLAFLFLIGCTSMGSCYYNKQFLFPDNFSQEWRGRHTNKSSGNGRSNTNIPKDRLIVLFSGDNQQPEFVDIEDMSTYFTQYDIRSVMFKNSDSISLNGWMIKPDTTSLNGRTIIYFHGSSGSMLSEFYTMLPLVDKGYQVFVVDFSGYGYSEGKAKRKIQLIDARATVDYVCGREDVKNTKVILYGQEYGAYTAIGVAAREQSKIDLLIAEAGFTDHRRLAEIRYSGLKGWFIKSTVRELYSANREINKVTIPKIIIHSETDVEMPYKMSQQLFDRAVMPKAFIKAQGGHLEAIKYNINDIEIAINRFLGD